MSGVGFEPEKQVLGTMKNLLSLLDLSTVTTTVPGGRIGPLHEAKDFWQENGLSPTLVTQAV